MSPQAHGKEEGHGLKALLAISVTGFVTKSDFIRGLDVIAKVSQRDNIHGEPSAVSTAALAATSVASAADAATSTHAATCGTDCAK